VVYLTPEAYLSVREAYDDVVAAIEDAAGTPKAGMTPEEFIELAKRRE
jgi:hypothetical protein